jgi:hypothetical protein
MIHPESERRTVKDLASFVGPIRFSLRYSGLNPQTRERKRHSCAATPLAKWIALCCIFLGSHRVVGREEREFAAAPADFVSRSCQPESDSCAARCPDRNLRAFVACDFRRAHAIALLSARGDTRGKHMSNLGKIPTSSQDFLSDETSCAAPPEPSEKKLADNLLPGTNNESVVPSIWSSPRSQILDEGTNQKSGGVENPGILPGTPLPPLRQEFKLENKSIGK